MLYIIEQPASFFSFSHLQDLAPHVLAISSNGNQKIDIYTNSVDMQIKSDWWSYRIQHKCCKCITPSNSLCASYGPMESIEVAVHVHCANRFIR